MTWSGTSTEVVQHARCTEEVASSHIAWPLGRQRLDPYSRLYGYYRPAPRPEQPVAPIVRRIYEAGYHAELNKRLKAELVSPLAGLADIDDFAAAATPAARRVVQRLAVEVHLA